MISENIQTVLKKLANILNENKINWMLIGSCNLAVQGMNFTPRDVDICVNLKDFDKINELFANYPEFKSGKFSSTFGGTVFKINFFMDDIEIEFIGEENQSIYSDSLIKNDYIKKESLYLNKLKNEYQAYVKMNRVEKATKIKEYLDNLIST